MTQNNIVKIVIGLLMVLAIGLGLIQRNQDPYLGSNKTGYNLIASDKSLESYYREASDLAKNSNSRTEISFLAVGDIMLSRNVAGQIEKHKNINYPFLAVDNILKSTDFNFGNLESPFYQTSKNCFASEAVGIIGGHSLIFGAPCLYVTGLRDYNFQILNLANNHALDQGLNGLKFTTSLLSDPNVEIQYTGAGENLKEAWKPAVAEAKGVKVCFVGASYASINDGGKAVNNYVARIEDVENLKLSIENAKSLCDFTVATMHAGAEYVRKPNKAQINFARAAIDAGADMVIGHHPHWIQTIEKYNDKYIFYSLGNFIFDQMWSENTRQGLALKVYLSKSVTPNLQGPKISATLDKIELIPVIIDNYSAPRPATENESKKILEKIGETQNIIYP